MVHVISRLLFTPTNTRLLRLLNVSYPLDVQSISKALGAKPSIVRRQLWELQRSRLVSHSFPTPEGQPSRFTVEIQSLQDALVVAAKEMGATDE
ncbi:hypothetical protein [Arthrobacter sp. AQ5-05]|uniref:hypothetical protein n=1 Tax=Arthrobacter sp. AQ5-05 TaxID=2184581 RepID=UPI0018A6E023|nr:hypothetical protein [Arthrobacter sp. AQ5-05]